MTTATGLFLLVYFWVGLFVAGVMGEFKDNRLVRGLLAMLIWPAWLVWRIHDRP